MDSSKENGWNSRARFPLHNWNRYQYEGLNLLRIDERWDSDENGVLDEDDKWRPVNVFVHGPGVIGNVVRASWYRYTWDNSDTPCESGSWVPAYDALGNQVGVVTNQNGGEFYRWETDAYGNSLHEADGFPNSFLGFDQEGPKEHLTGKMFDTDTGYYCFHARWYDPGVGRFLSRDPVMGEPVYGFVHGNPVMIVDTDGRIGASKRHCDAIARNLRSNVNAINTQIEAWADDGYKEFRDYDVGHLDKILGLCRRLQNSLGQHTWGLCLQKYPNEYTDINISARNVLINVCYNKCLDPERVRALKAIRERDRRFIERQQFERATQGVCLGAPLIGIGIIKGGVAVGAGACIPLLPAPVAP